jgi:hypothetical protein
MHTNTNGDDGKTDATGIWECQAQSLRSGIPAVFSEATVD